MTILQTEELFLFKLEWYKHEYIGNKESKVFKENEKR